MTPKVLLAVCALLLIVPAAGAAPPTFSKQFDLDTIGPGSVSVLRFDIVNVELGTPLLGLAFTDTLPGAVVIATPAAATSDCGGALSAPDGGGVISLSGGELGAGEACAITVHVTSSTPGAWQNVSGALTSSAGNSGTADATLTVDAGRPGFTKSFAPSTVPPGVTSTLTFTIDNTANPDNVFLLDFDDVLPAGLVVATPANAGTDCGTAAIPPTLTADPGTDLIGLSAQGFAPNFPALSGGAACTVSVDVTPTSAGRKENVTGNLLTTNPTSGTEESGKAGAVLDVELQLLRKLFTDDPVAPGGTVTLEFTLTNFDRNGSATDIAFSDDLGAALPGLAATGLPLADPCGAGSQLSGTSTLSFTGGSLPPEGSCAFSVTLDVPGGAMPGTYTNTTSPVSLERAGLPVTEDPATDRLVVAAAPTLSKEFVDDPVAGGGSVILRFTITNTSGTAMASDIAFTDNLDAVLPGLSPTLPADGFCGPGSEITQVGNLPPNFGIGLSMTGGNLPASGSCTFAVVLTLPSVAPGGSFLNQTSPITATVGGTALTGGPASDSLLVAAAPALSKSFVDDPVVPGGNVRLEFALAHAVDAPGDATAIAFSDDLAATLSGLTAMTPLPLVGVCGAGSQLGGTTTNLSFTGGSLAPGASCTFGVDLAVPAAAPAGNHENATSAVSASVLGLAVSSIPAVDLLEVAGLVLTKSFTNSPVLAGGTADLEFTLENKSPVSSAFSIAFDDDLDAALPGLAAIGLPANNVCGGGSQLSGTGQLSFTGGSLAPGGSCTFGVGLAVPAGVAAGVYTNATGQVSADFGGTMVTVAGASDELEVTVPLSLAKSFLDDPVPPGGNVTLQFTLANSDPVENATQLAFSDDLDAALSNLVASGLPSNPCGGTISGAGVLSFSGGSLGPMTSCDFSVTLDVPASAAADATNVTSELTGLVGGVATSGAPATDRLEVDVCLAADGENLTLSGDTVLDTKVYEVCGTIELGPNYQVAGPNGNLTLRAGDAISFGNGFSVGVDGTLSAGIGADL